MGFKTLSKKMSESEFLDGARGETGGNEGEFGAVGGVSGVSSGGVSGGVSGVGGGTANLSSEKNGDFSLQTKNKNTNTSAETAQKKGLKRDKTILVYFTNDELERLKNEADANYMNVNQYVRFKLFCQK